jgi:hypothetical protein
VCQLENAFVPRRTRSGDETGTPGDDISRICVALIRVKSRAIACEIDSQGFNHLIQMDRASSKGKPSQHLLNVLPIQFIDIDQHPFVGVV